MRDVSDGSDDNLECECGHKKMVHYPKNRFFPRCTGAVPEGPKDKRKIPRYRANACPCKGFKEKG